MAKNKSVLISGNPSVIMRERKNEPKKALHLYYYIGVINGKKKYKCEALNLWLWNKKHLNTEESEHNREVKAVAAIKREQKEKEYNKNNGYVYPQKRDKINFYKWFETYISEYDKADVRVVEMALRRFKLFISESKKYNMFKDIITPEQITPEMISSFVEKLERDCSGSGAQSVYKRFKKVVRAATKERVFFNNPCEGIAAHKDQSGELRKDVLTAEEIVKLISCKYERQNDDTRRAFIFCLFTGLRFCDVKTLKYGSIDRVNKLLTIRQSKTKKNVSIPLRDDVLNLIGKGGDNEKIFILPSIDACNKSVQKWVDKAGIDKHITWHCARHSFGANTYYNLKDLRATSELLGHSDTSMTQIYTKVFDERKREVVNSLPSIEE